MNYKIGNLRLKNNLVLAPMAGINDTAFRMLCKRYGAGLVYTEMINANAIFNKNKATLKKLNFVEEERPIAVQLFGANLKMLESAAVIAEEKADIIDINFGCPDLKVLNQGCGAALLKRPKRISEIIKAVVNKVSIPVTAKIRIGTDSIKIARLIEDAGASAIAVHARTVRQGYSGKADWSKIREIKEAVNIPIIGNGDVFTKEDAENMQKSTKCDFIMIGRAAMTNPAIFKEITNGKISSKEKLDLFFEYIELAEKYNCYKFVTAKRHALNFTRGMPNSTRLRERISLSKTIDEVKESILSFDNC
ncbi:tRNA dihydrouridine synthase DusB [Candidatus Woesearchaeota archaeon]|nr:hypothetical protein [uncultured archaeon]MBS3163242.1 tRNA dihydrouridine synthase DusB [Candidatus Woesearchaeota archaeon]